MQLRRMSRRLLMKTNPKTKMKDSKASITDRMCHESYNGYRTHQLMIVDDLINNIYWSTKNSTQWT